MTKRQKEIINEMTELLVKHVETMPKAERDRRWKALEKYLRAKK
jgi:hypothetical protein